MQKGLLNTSQDAQQREHDAHLDGEHGREVESEAEAVDPELVLGPRLPVLNELHGYANRRHEDGEPNEHDAREGRVVVAGVHRRDHRLTRQLDGGV